MNNPSESQKHENFILIIVINICSEKLTVATLNAAILLFTSCFGKLTVEQNVHILETFIKMLLSALCATQSFVTKKILHESTIATAFDTWESALRNWIVNPSVVGGSTFGGSLSQAALQEMEVRTVTQYCSTG